MWPGVGGHPGHPPTHQRRQGLASAMPAAHVLGLHPAGEQGPEGQKGRIGWDSGATTKRHPEHHLASGPAFLTPVFPGEAWLQRDLTTCSDLFENILGRRAAASGLGLEVRAGREASGKELGAHLEVTGSLAPFLMLPPHPNTRLWPPSWPRLPPPHLGTHCTERSSHRPTWGTLLFSREA